MFTRKYFTTCTTVEELKTLYRKLAKQHHPDLGGDLETMQAINAEYHATLKRHDGTKVRGDDGKERTYTYNQEIEQAIMDKINETLAARIINDRVELWLIGTWIWVEGDTKPIKEILKAMGYMWHSKRAMWYWQNDGRKHYYSKTGFDTLAAKYGAQKFTRQQEKELA